MAMGSHPNVFFKFSGTKRPQAKKIGERIVLEDLIQDRSGYTHLDVIVNWWEELPSGQEIHGITTYADAEYDVTVVVQSNPVNGRTTNPIDSDYVKLVHHIC